MSDKLDVSYFKKNLEVILSSITYYTAEEMERTLLTLAAVLAADKPDFDITKHEWSDKNLFSDGSMYQGKLQIVENDVIDGIVHLSKADTIALAKHFKLTAEDLS